MINWRFPLLQRERTTSCHQVSGGGKPRAWLFPWLLCPGPGCGLMCIPLLVSAALPDSPVTLVVVLIAVLLLLVLGTTAFFLYRRRQSTERGSFEGARYSRSSSGPAEATEKNILVSDMEMNEQQE